MEIVPMKAQDYQDVYKLWKASEGICLRAEDDSREAIEKYLARNPGLSLVAREEGVAAGAIMCGHDGRRGYLYHLAVGEEFRRRGIGRALVEKAVENLKQQGINKCHIFVFAQNDAGREFWEDNGFKTRPEIEFRSRDIAGAGRQCC